jgi:hypothetical protein
LILGLDRLALSLERQALTFLTCKLHSIYGTCVSKLVQITKYFPVRSGVLMHGNKGKESVMEFRDSATSSGMADFQVVKSLY